MAHEPKKRHSRARQGKRRSALNLTITSASHKLTKFLKLQSK
jgi:ribosomal protein L32